MNGPVDYGMCCQTVTVYRKAVREISRTVIPGCYLRWQTEAGFDVLGHTLQRKFLLVQPGDMQLVFAGDRVFDGVGPEITAELWDSFLPQQVEGLGIVTYAVPYQWEGRFCHTEAGRK